MLTTLSNLRAENSRTSPFTTGEELVVSVKFGDDPAARPLRKSASESPEVWSTRCCRVKVARSS
jgi:hypothetical protein